MAITFIKKPKLVELPIDDLSEEAGLIDEIGEMLPEVEKTQAAIKKLSDSLKPYNDRLIKLIEYMSAKGDDDDGLIEKGTKFVAIGGAKAISREITDMLKVIELMGEEQFLAVASVKLGDIDKYLTEPQRKEVLAITRGKRKVKVSPRQE